MKNKLHLIFGIFFLVISFTIAQNYNPNYGNNYYDNYYAYGSNSYYSQYASQNENYRNNYYSYDYRNDPNYVRNNFDSRYQNNQFSDPYYNRYPQNTYGNYPDSYNRFDNGYNQYGNSFNPQFNPPGTGFANSFNSGSGNCIQGQDLILQIAPGGCRPAVVRSDLLEEQNVPVFCKIMAIQANPLIDVTRIRNIRIKGEYPKGVSGISYYPARVAVGGKPMFAESFFEGNLGYLVVVLSRQPNEREIPDIIQGNITAYVDYISEASFCLDDSRLYLSPVSESEWQSNYRDYGFWNGRGYIRVDKIEGDSAVGSLYRDVNTRHTTVTLRKDQISAPVFMPGYYCAAGMQLRLDDISGSLQTALVNVNGNNMWLAKGDRLLNDRCRVIDLQSTPGGGTLKIRCPGKELVLNLAPGSASVSYSGAEFVDKSVGEQLHGPVFLSYIGQDSENKRYAVLIQDTSKNNAEFANKNVLSIIHQRITPSMNIADIKARVIPDIVNHYKKLNIEGKVEIIAESETAFGVTLHSVNVATNKNFDYSKLTTQQQLAHDYYGQTLSAYEDLIDKYPNEKAEFLDDDPYAAKALLNMARLSRLLGMDGNAHTYYNRILNEYSNSFSANIARYENRNLLHYDTSKARASVSLGNELYSFTLLDFKIPRKENFGVVMNINNEIKTLGLGEETVVSKDSFIHRFRIASISDTQVEIDYERRGGILEKPEIRKERFDSKNFQRNINNVNINLIHINRDKQVKLSFVQSSTGPRTESDFTFTIGIEKRAIQLSPKRTKEMMKNLQETINAINKVNQNLGNVIRVMKAACFATSALLTVKNAINKNTPEAISRNLLMTKPGGWNDQCEDLVNRKVFSTVQECLLKNKGVVGQDLSIYSQEIKNTDSIIKNIENKNKITNGLFDSTVDTQKVQEEFKQVFDSWCKDNNDKIKIPGKSEISFGNSESSACNWESLSHEQRRDIMLNYNLRNKGSSVLQNVSNTELNRVLVDAKTRNEEYLNRVTQDSEANKYNLGIHTTDPHGDIITQGYIKTVSQTDLNHAVYRNFNVGSHVVRVQIPNEKVFGQIKFELSETVKKEIGGKQVLVEMVYSSDDNYYYPKSDGKIYRIDGVTVSKDAADKVREYMSLSGMDKVKQVGKNAYNNKMINDQQLRVKYFENAPYKGLPAEIPFDVQNGWYVEMTYIISGFGRPYDESGRAVNFYICNVGENGLIEFKQSADDICRYYNSVNPDLSFPGMTSQQSILLVQNARRAIEEAVRQYGNSKETINGRTFDKGVATGGSEGRCTDFMSIEDCTLMFNVCDPVICPPSRCDFGGRYRVDDVIQSGVVGSLLLCLSNFKEGVAIPICLTGVHAGLDGYVSILNSTIDCLNESLTTGRNVGICDEIKSIYICEFFWKQAVPLVELAIPRLFEGNRGGGEYLTIQDSYKNTQTSVDYFAQVYGRNSLKAFSQRNINYAGTEVGTEICKSFISANFGGVSTMFRNLIEPDSPVQYTAWFSENPLTTATVPPTSHYKVYYHIYAGKDFGAYYVVYLKDSGAVQGRGAITSPNFIVDRGYVNRGSQVDRARDITAVSGFKQLCINVNGQDNCGFGKITSSYAINSLTEGYVADQIQTGIKHENECIAGTPSFGSLINPNIQAGVEEYINPALYNKGIVRVCSSDNPGKQVLPSGEYDRTNSSYDRWTDVGFCDDPSIRCWLDTSSVKQVIRDKAIEKSVLGNVDEQYVNSIDAVNLMTYEQSRGIADHADNFINNFNVAPDDTRQTIDLRIRKVVMDLQYLSDFGTTNMHRARAEYF